MRTGIGAWIAACVLATAPAALGQQPAPEAKAPPEASEPAPADPTAEPAPFPDEFDRQTPRRSVYGFLDAGRHADWERAANYLNQSPIPEAERDELAPVLARKLKLVLDRELWVDLQRLSAEPEGDRTDDLPARFDRVGTLHTDGGPVDILVERIRRPDGKRIWKIAGTTVARIPDLYEEFGFGVLGEMLPPIFFAEYGLDVQLWQWIGLIALVLVAYLGSWAVVWILNLVLRPLVARSTNAFDDRLLENIRGPARLIAAVLIFSGTVLVLGLSPPAMRFFSAVEKALVVVAVTWLSLRFINVFANLVEERLDDQKAARSLVPLGRRTVQGVVVALAVLAALDSFGFDVTAVIAGLGVGGIAIALAAQKTLENLFGGATIIADRPVQVGDFCRFGDKVGTVELIGLRSTRVRTLDRTLVTVPNAEFSSLQLENFTARDKIWYHPTIGLLYETTPDQMRYVLVEVRKMLYAHPKVHPDPARIRFVTFGAYSLDLEIFAYVKATDYGEYLEIAEDLNLRIMDIVEKSGTGFAFPSNTTYLGKDAGADPEKTKAAEETVAEWRSRNALFLPGFPAQKIDELRDTLDYPNEGTPLRPKRTDTDHGDA